MITKQLKYGIFSYDENTHEFVADVQEGYTKMNKVYAFAFVRFVLRIAQRNWLRKIKK